MAQQFNPDVLRAGNPTFNSNPDTSLGGGKSGPAPQAYKAAAEKQNAEAGQNLQTQTLANRPNVSTPFASDQWVQGPDGQWTRNIGLSGGFGSVAGGLGNQAQGLLGQAQSALSAPMDWSPFGAIQTGDQARQQAIDAAYGQSTSRLDPMFSRREEALRTQLLNQGLDPTSEAFENAMGDLGRERTDAYQAALNSAIGQGTTAGQAAFTQNLQARQQALAEALRRRGQPLEELQSTLGLAGGLQGFLQTPSFIGAGQLAPTNYLGALQAMQNQAQQQQQAAADTIGAIPVLGQGVASVGSLFGLGGR